MRGATLLQQHPPTPPSAGSDYQSMEQLAQYNANHTFPFEGSSYPQSRKSTHDGTPSHTPRVDSHSGESLVLGIHLNGYEAGADYQEGGHEGAPVQFNVCDLFVTETDMKPQGKAVFSPPTPRSTIEDDTVRRTRNGRPVAGSCSPVKRDASPRPKASPRSKKAKPGKTDKSTMPKLTAPLSELTADLKNIPVKDMEEWVNRSAEVRREEAERRNGYITRPMNSFMLYRSAYAERAKAWCAQNNHQIVSSVAGESWPLEPPEIREQYNEYAKTERINHQNAHPTYKFSPSKVTPPARKRRDEWSDEDEPSDLDDTEWGEGHGRSRSKQMRRMSRSFSYPSHSLHGDFFDRSFGPNGNGMNKSSWEMTNEGKPMPMPIHGDMYNQYYQTPAYPSLHMNHTFHDDHRMRRINAPTMQFSSNHALLGLPGNNVDLMQQIQSQVNTPFEEAQLDPMLLAYDGSGHSAYDSATLQQHFHHGRSDEVDEKFNQHNVSSLLDPQSPHEYHPQTWQPDPTMISLDHESEFDKWVGEH